MRRTPRNTGTERTHTTLTAPDPTAAREDPDP